MRSALEFAKKLIPRVLMFDGKLAMVGAAEVIIKEAQIDALKWVEKEMSLAYPSREQLLNKITELRDEE